MAPKEQALDCLDFHNSARRGFDFKTLGNFINRTLTFAARYFEGKVPQPSARGEADLAQLRAIAECAERTTENLEAFRFKGALGEIMNLARTANAYFDAKQPWKQRKDDLPGCGTTINVCIQTVRALATLMAPFLPFSAAKAAGMLRIDPALTWDTATHEFPAGHALGEPAILFKKLDPAELFTQ